MTYDAAFYDALADDPANAYFVPLEESVYADLWRRAAALVGTGNHVVDLGCGTGRLASLLIPSSRSYLGLDFSSVLLQEARIYNEGARHRIVEFRQGDVREVKLPWADVYVATELLEHLPDQDDLLLLWRLAGREARIVVSVPSFDSASHVRTFPDEASVRERYEGLIAIDHYEQVPLGEHCFHLIRGTC